jgi:hypothetical protein
MSHAPGASSAPIDLEMLFSDKVTKALTINGRRRRLEPPERLILIEGQTKLKEAFTKAGRVAREDRHIKARFFCCHVGPP